MKFYYNVYTEYIGFINFIQNITYQIFDYNFTLVMIKILVKNKFIPQSSVFLISVLFCYQCLRKYNSLSTAILSYVLTRSLPKTLKNMTKKITTITQKQLNPFKTYLYLKYYN